MKALPLLMAFVVVALAEPVTVSWDTNSEPYVAGYRVLYGTASKVYTLTNTVTGRLNTSVTISNPPSGVVYFAATAFTGNGKESVLSEEVTWTPRPSAPRSVKLSATLQGGNSPVGPWTNLANFAFPLPIVEDQRFFRTRLLLEELP